MSIQKRGRKRDRQMSKCASNYNDFLVSPLRQQRRKLLFLEQWWIWARDNFLKDYFFIFLYMNKSVGIHTGNIVRLSCEASKRMYNS
jgi:hypothetical protein